MPKFEGERVNATCIQVIKIRKPWLLIVKTPLYLNLTSNPHTPPLKCKFGGGLCGCRVRGQGQKEWRLFDEKSDISVFLWLRDSTKFTLLSCAIRRAGCCTDYATACMPKHARERCEFGGNPKATKKKRKGGCTRRVVHITAKWSPSKYHKWDFFLSSKRNPFETEI